MTSPRRTLSPAEAGRLALAALAAVGALAVTAGDLLPYELVGRDPRRAGAEDPPIRTPLPDLCAWTPRDRITGLLPGAPYPGSGFASFETVRCRWQAGPPSTGRWVEITAERPDPLRLRNEEPAARALFSRTQAVTPGRSAGRVRGLGDEAKLVTWRAGTLAGASLVVRDGILVVRIDHEREAPLPDDVPGELRRLAADLLRVLPPEGL